MKRRRAVTVFLLAMMGASLLAVALYGEIQKELSVQKEQRDISVHQEAKNDSEALYATDALETLAVKGRAPKTGYSRSEFGNGWGKVQGCTVRNIILYRDLSDVVMEGECVVASGWLNDPYAGERIEFTKEKSSSVQIDHVVALSDAWQKGAQQLTKEQRIRLANDPLELIAVSGTENQAKSDGDAATWLPKNKGFRCMYVARQIAVKVKYNLWVTTAEKEAMAHVLKGCHHQALP